MKLLMLILLLYPASISSQSGRPFTFEHNVLDFALRAHRHIVEPGKTRQNVIFSPLNLISAMTTMMAGANETTYEELKTFLGYPDYIPDNLIHDGYAIILRKLLQTNRGVELSVATRLFKQRDLPVLPEFQERAFNNYSCEVQPVEFSRPEVTRGIINNYVKAETRGHIPELLQRPLSPLSKLALVTAVYFKGDWSEPFDVAFTRNDSVFHVTPRETVPVKLMSNIINTPFINYQTARLKCTMLGLAYKDKDFGLFAILPEEEGIEGLAALEEKLTAEDILQMIASMRHEDVTVNFPRLKQSMRQNMARIFDRMGVKTLFKPGKVNLSRLSPAKISLNDCVHQAEIEINEKGTEAAAAAGTTLNRLRGNNNFIADRPFLLFIRDNKTGMPVFWGRVVRP